MAGRRFPVAPIRYPAAIFVRDANGQALVYVIRATTAEALQVLTKDEARRIAINGHACRSCSAKRIEDTCSGPIAPHRSARD